MIKGRKIVTLLIAAAAAVLLWLYVVTSVAPEATARINSIPVTIDGSIILEERGLIITKRNTTAVSLEVSASRSDLSKLNASSIRISADASKIRSPGDYELSYTVIFPDTVNTGDIDILRKSTNRVGVTVEKLEKKTLALSTHWENSVQDGYIAELASAVIEPAEVTLVGPENEISQITEARVSFDLASRNETVFETVPIAFLNKDGEEVSLSEYTNVTVTDATLTLQIFKEKKLTLKAELVGDNVIHEDNAVVSYSIDTITVKGAAEVIDAMPDELVVGTPIELSSIDGSKKTFHFNLDLPAGVVNESGETTVDVTIKFEGISSATIPITDISVINPMEGYEATVVSKTVYVTVRGDTEEVNKIREASGKGRDVGIRVQVDLQGSTQTAASFTARGKVINEDHPNLAVVEEVVVSISLTKISET